VKAGEEQVQLYLGEHETASADHDLPHGFVCVRSVRAPDKETPNEDAAAVIQVGADSLVLAIADGVGGTPLGREASNAAVRTLCRVLGEQPVEDAARLRPAILDAVEEANKTVLEIAHGAATTLVIAELVSTRLRSYHIGDSEMLTVGQRGRIKSRVVPHSPTGFAVEAGLMDENEAMQHDQRHILSNVIGAQDMRVEIGPALQLAVHDTVLLASDGLLDNVFLDEIVEIIRKGPLPIAADRLVAVARARMGGDGTDGPCKPDDLTVILFRPHAKRTAAV
jgi:serine/threonine protein phosphatase PrpC